MRKSPAGGSAPVRLWAMPILLGALSALGLIVALVGDGLWDAVSWVGLGIPLIVIIWFWQRAKVI